MNTRMMEQITNPPLPKKRKLITKASERITPFNKIRKAYLPKKQINDRSDIRDYFTSKVEEQTKINAINLLEKSENATTKSDPPQKPCIEVSYPIFQEIKIRKNKTKNRSTSLPNAYPKTPPKFNAKVLTNGIKSGKDETNLSSPKAVNGHLNIPKNISNNHSDSITIANDIKASPSKSNGVCLTNGETNDSFDCQTLSESSLKINGCELKPYLKRIDPMQFKCCSASSSPTEKRPKVQKRKVKSLGLNESWIIKKSKGSKNVPSESKKEKRDVYDNPFEVETVVDYSWCKQTCQGLYNVKWIGYDESQNTWEPLEHLDCAEKLKEFYAKRLKEREKALPGRKRFLEVPPDPRTNFERRSETADRICPPPCMSEVEAFFIKLDKMKDRTWPESKLNHQLELIAKTKKLTDNKIYENRLKQVKEQIMLRHVKEKRAEQLKNLKEWIDEVNTLDRSSTGNSQNAKITVVNDVDLEGPPRHMTYMNSYKPSDGIIIPDDPPIGCECIDGKCCLKTERTCCPSSNGHLMAYNASGRLRVEVGTPIYECNKICKCDKECTNRVVQKGRKVKLCIYRTDNGCGWGVKALENIKKGSFVVEYVGEVITSEEAEERGKKYDAEGRTYLFDLDFNMGNENPYTVDAAFYGNVSHFINHSCDPNLSIFNVWIDCLDPNLPRLCLFANRNISKNEQLNFDYRQRTGYESEKEESDSAEDDADKTNHNSLKMECRCGATNCRKILFG